MMCVNVLGEWVGEGEGLKSRPAWAAVAYASADLLIVADCLQLLS